MAEFAEVMRQWGRYCKRYTENHDDYCHGCRFESNVSCISYAKDIAEYAEQIEKHVMSWAAEHQEPVYPTWGDWLAEQGVVIKDKIGENKYKYNTLRKVSTPIPADIAEKLGVKPKEGT